MPRASKKENGLKLISPETCLTVSLDVGIGYTGMGIWSPDGALFRLLLIAAPITHKARKSHRMATDILGTIFYQLGRYHGTPKRILLVVEGYGYGSGFFNVDQAEIIGVLKKAVIESPGLYAGMVFLAPNTVKKAVAGDGKATKSAIKKAVKPYLTSENTTSHEADAVAVFLAYKKLWASVTPETYGVCILNGD